jgi:hypothetical protein
MASSAWLSNHKWVVIFCIGLSLLFYVNLNLLSFASNHRDEYRMLMPSSMLTKMPSDLQPTGNRLNRESGPISWHFKSVA